MAIVVLAAFAILAALVSMTNSPLTNIDTKAFLAINNSHAASLDEFMIDLTRSGREEFWIVTVILLFIFGGWSGKKTSVVMAISMVVLIIVGTIAKEVIGRDRPVIPASEVILTPDSDRSFPSGHATIVSSGGAIALALFRNSRTKFAISIVLTIEALLVCVSRVYVGGIIRRTW